MAPKQRAWKESAAFIPAVAGLPAIKRPIAGRVLPFSEIFESLVQANFG